jgi:hypothetical protein
VSTARFIPAPDQGDAEVVVLAVELFQQAVVVVLVTTILGEVIDSGLFEPGPNQIRITDDLGTEYRRAFGVGSSFAGDERRWSGSRGVDRSNLEFEPPVPAGATYLRITLGPWGNVVVTV